MTARCALFAAAVGALTLSGCPHETGLAYDSIGFDVVRDETTVVAVNDATCTVIPKLLGSVVEERFPLDGTTILVRATRDEAVVTFEGASGEPEVRIDADRLQRGFEQRLDVVSGTGVAYGVTMVGGCASSSPDAD